MLRSIAKLLLAFAAIGACAAPNAVPAYTARYNVYCAAPNGPWCRISCASNTGVACYANVVNGRCEKRCIYR